MIVFDNLAKEFELLFNFKVACVAVPNVSYKEIMELKVQVHDMVVATLLGLDQWKSIQQYGSSKYNTQL